MNELINLPLSTIRQPRVSQNISIPRHANAEPEFVVKTFDRLDKVFRGNKIPGTEKGRGEYKWRQPSQVCTTNQTTKQYFKQTHKLTNQQNSPNKN